MGNTTLEQELAHAAAHCGDIGDLALERRLRDRLAHLQTLRAIAWTLGEKADLVVMDGMNTKDIPPADAARPTQEAPADEGGDHVDAENVRGVGSERGNQTPVDAAVAARPSVAVANPGEHRVATQEAKPRGTPSRCSCTHAPEQHGPGGCQVLSMLGVPCACFSDGRRPTPAAPPQSVQEGTVHAIGCNERPCWCGAAPPQESGTAEPMRGVRSLTRNMLEMMSHALGQSRGGRNYYCVGAKTADADDWRWLIEQGYAAAGRLINDDRDAIFHVTAKGMAVVLNGPAASPQEGKREPGSERCGNCFGAGYLSVGWGGARCGYCKGTGRITGSSGKREPGEKP